MAQSLRANHWLGLEPVGFVDDPEPEDCSGKRQTLGTIDQLAEVIERLGAEYVFVCLPLHRYAQTKRIFRNLSDTLVEIRLVPDVPHLAGMTAEMCLLEGLPVLSIRAAPHGPADLIAKRVMDVAFSALGLFGAFAPAGDHCLDHQMERWRPDLLCAGAHGAQRPAFPDDSSSVACAWMPSKVPGPVWACRDDNRRTRFGAFLRATSLDELPQLVNVLRGEMSLVGPRPERPHFIDNFRQSIPRYMLRHAVKSGITGWAQVNGWRGDTSLRKRVQYDLYYISNWSLWLDIRILFLTLLRAMWDKHAY